MGVTEIVLLVMGILFFIASFFIPERTNKKDDEEAKREIHNMIEAEVSEAKERINDMVEETVNYSVEKTERALERLSNEKIMAVDEYSETVLKKINDNHQEAVFLYDMLNDKDEKLKTTTEEINDRDSKVKERELELKLKDVQMKADEVSRRNKELEEEKIRLEQEEKQRLEMEEKAASEMMVMPNRKFGNSPEEDDEGTESDAFVPFIVERVEINKESKPVTEKATKAPKSKETQSTKSSQSAAGSRSKSTKPRKTIDDDNIELHFDKGNENRKNSNEAIIRMHEEGKSNMAIAKELGLGIGEVKLVIDLYSKH